MKIEIKTVDQARRFIKSKNINIQPGHAYNIYRCGCIVRNDKDPNSLVYIPNFKPGKYRTCPNPKHFPSLLINKYKRCNCGAEYFSKRVQASVQCSACKNIKLENVLSPFPEKIKHFKSYKGGDFDRIHCGNRMQCLGWAESENLQVLPCRDCPDYWLQHGGSDPLATVAVVG